MLKIACFALFKYNLIFWEYSTHAVTVFRQQKLAPRIMSGVLAPRRHLFVSFKIMAATYVYIFCMPNICEGTWRIVQTQPW